MFNITPVRVNILVFIVMLTMLNGTFADSSSPNKGFLPAVSILLDRQNCPDKVEIMGNGIDDDCDGQIDEPIEICDSGLSINDADPFNGAASIEICQKEDGKKWGIIDASYTRADGSKVSPGLQAGILSLFGSSTPPRSGERMLYLSTGTARLPGQPGACNDESCFGTGLGTPPLGYPQNFTDCPVGSTIADDIALEITLLAPTNATGFQFTHFFTSFDFPSWVCTEYNDQFIVQVDPPPPGSQNGNVVFDSALNSFSTSLPIFEHCNPATLPIYANHCTAILGCVPPLPPSPYCPEGDSILNGTGFKEWTGLYADDSAGATGWLRTTVPIQPGHEFTLRFLIWDTGDDGYLDSSVLVDKFEWLTGTVNVGTGPL